MLALYFLGVKHTDVCFCILGPSQFQFKVEKFLSGIAFTFKKSWLKGGLTPHPPPPATRGYRAPESLRLGSALAGHPQVQARPRWRHASLRPLAACRSAAAPMAPRPGAGATAR